jgi:hypothetical protein
VFDENQETNWAIRRAKNVIIHLMQRMGVSLERNNTTLERSNSRDSSADNDTVNLHAISATPMMPSETVRVDTVGSSPYSQADPETAELNMDMIIRSFIAQGNYGMANANAWCPQLSEWGTRESGSVTLGMQMGLSPDHRHNGGDLSFHDFAFRV